MEKQYRIAVRAAGDGFDFVLSDGALDRHGTRINPKGWVLDNFKRNPVALFAHGRDMLQGTVPIGTWENVRTVGDKLVATLAFAAEGTSVRIDELRKLVQQNIIRATSVGFYPLKFGTAGKDDFDYVEQELLECSLCGVPSNPNALAAARALNISDETMVLAFGEQAVMRQNPGTTGEQAVLSINEARAKAGLPPLKDNAMKTLSQRIEDAQKKLTELRDQLTEHLEKAGEDPTEADMAVTDELNGKIAAAQRSADQLQEAERQLASQATRTNEDTPANARRPLTMPARKLQPGELVIRSLVARVVAHAQKRQPLEVLAERYGEDGKTDDATRAVFNVVTRAASAPADTTTSGWASQLVETQIAEFMGLLIPDSVYPGLSSRGLRLNFGRSGVISIPSRAATPTIAGSFVAQGAPIPVRQGAYANITLTPKKMAVISAFTREIAEHSTPAIEGLIRNAIQEDTSVALDSILLDATAASSTRPAGLRNGVTVTTATSGGGFAALVGDIKALVGALVTAANGQVRKPVWIMNPIQALSIALTQNAGGDFPFATEVNGNRLQGYPVIQSTTVTAGMVILVDAADFVSVEGDAPRFDMSDQATLHMEDSAPVAIGTAGTPNVVAAPVRSLWQTDSMALRMIMDVNWCLRRTGIVAWTQSVTW